MKKLAVQEKGSAKRKPNSPILLGAHMSIAGGVHAAIQRACSVKCTAMQMFVKNNMQWFAPPLCSEEIRAFVNHAERAQLASIVGHANYLINLATTNPQFYVNSLRALAEELIRADQLELPFLVMHPGAHMGAGEDAGLAKIIAAIDQLFEALPKIKTRIALETTAGQGSCLGHKFEQIRCIIDNVREPDRLAVCLDTAHVFAAGYDISSEHSLAATLGEFDRIIGRKRLAAIHLNDSKAKFGSRVDRHAHIGEGEIGLAAFRFIMNDPKLRNVPKVLETPKGKDLREDVVNLRTLRGLIENGNGVRTRSRHVAKQSRTQQVAGQQQRR